MADGADRIYPVDDDKPVRPVFSDIFLIQKRAKRRFVIPGTEGDPGYGFKVWMKSYALPEHLLQWPLLLCPLDGGGAGRDRSIVDEIINIEEIM